MRVRIWCLSIVIGALAACGTGSGEGNGPGPGTPTSDGSTTTPTPTPDTATTPPGDVASGDVADAGPTAEPGVYYMGIYEKPLSYGLFCGGESVEVVVKAVELGERALRLAILKPASQGNPETVIKLDVEPEALGTDDLWLFTLNTSPLTIPEEGLEDISKLKERQGTDKEQPEDAAKIAEVEQMVLEEGKTFDLMVIGYEFNSDGYEVMPSVEAYAQTIKLTYDNKAPTLEVVAPSPDFDLETMSGYADMQGSLYDAGAVGYVQVTFDGTVLATYHPAEDSNGKQLSYEAVADLRREPTKFGQLMITGYDACGHPTVAKCSSCTEPGIPVKLIAWPWLRTYPRFFLPGSQTINDSVVVDWDGDGYLDVLFGSAKGIWVALNDGEDTPDGLHVNFSSVTPLPIAPTEENWEVGVCDNGEPCTLDNCKGASPVCDFDLTPLQSEALAVTDFDKDGLMDIVSVSRVGAQGLSLVVLRNVGGGEPFNQEESHVLPIAGTTQIRGLVVDDFDQDAEGLDDVIVVTSAQEESLLFYKRLNNGELETEVCTSSIETIPDTSSGAEKDAVIEFTSWTCPSLFTDDPAIAGGVDDITHVEVADVTGSANAGPDGYPDLVVGADGVNQIFVYPNRFGNGDQVLQDTAFSTAEGSFVWPISSTSLERTRFFCLGDFVEVDDEQGADGQSANFVDVVVGGEYSGTWRTLVGKGDGTFYNEPPASGIYADLEIFNMAGTVANDIKGMACGDLNGDGLQDFLVLSATAKTMQVHLGDGHGRYNQVGEDPLLNPANEAIGFAMDRFAERPVIADFNNDGLDDVMVDFRLGSFSVMTNLTPDTDTELPLFDLDATRVLVTPLGKIAQASGGIITNIAIGDMTGDSTPDIVAMTDNKPFAKHQWISAFHPLAAEYRGWLTLDGTKALRSPTVFIWSSDQGTYGDKEPSYPAAYDRFPKASYDAGRHGSTNVKDMKLIDVADVVGEPEEGLHKMQKDGYLDIVVTGAPAGGTPLSHISVYVNQGTGSSSPNAEEEAKESDAPSEKLKGLWDSQFLTEADFGTFVPLNGAEVAFTTPETFVFFTPPGTGFGTPGIFVPANGGISVGCATLSPILRFCPWNDRAKEGDSTESDDPTEPYWDCWTPSSCDATLGTKFGGQAKKIVKLELGPNGEIGAVDEDPYTAGHLLVTSSGGENLSLYRYDPSKYPCGCDGDSCLVSDFLTSLEADPNCVPQGVPIPWPKAPNINWYFDEPQHLAVGKNPVDLAVEDINGDDLADIVVTVQKNVMIGFGDTQNPYESFQPVDKRPGFEQSGGVHSVILSDVNNDTFKDIVFTETSASNLTVYLAVGQGSAEESAGYKRQYHGPISIPVCSQPTILKAVDFDEDGCDTLVVLCEGSGAVTVMQNDTCKLQAE